jgi:hypothetical protein
MVTLEISSRLRLPRSTTTALVLKRVRCTIVRQVKSRKLGTLKAQAQTNAVKMSLVQTRTTGSLQLVVAPAQKVKPLTNHSNG